jgi:ankyrin repeat protein
MLAAVVRAFCSHPSPEIAFQTLFLFGVSDFLKALELEDEEVLDAQLAAFRQFLPREMLHGTPVAHLACLLSTRLHLVQRVIDACGPAILDGDGRNALFYAVTNATRVVPQLLLEAGTEVAQADAFGETPIAFAVAQEVDELDRFLYGFPSKPTPGEHKFASALHAIAAGRDLDRFRALLPFLGPLINETVGAGQYLLHLLIDNGIPQAVWALAAVPGFDPNKSSRSAPHPLHYLLGKKMAVKEWLNALLALPSLDVNARSAQPKARGQTPLCAAVVAQEAVMVEALVRDERCRIDLPNEGGQTPLMLAVAGDVAIVDLLIAAGAEVNAPGADGETALMKALELPGGEVAEKLIAAGANAKLWYAHGKLAGAPSGLPSFA